MREKVPFYIAKLLVNKAKDRIVSNFYDATTDEPLDPMTLVQKRCHVVCALKIESIFIGRVITIQFKCREANIELHGNFSNQRLLPALKTKPAVKKSCENESESGSGSESESGSESSASLNASPKKVVKKVVKRRVVRKKGKVKFKNKN